jgi:flagellar hook-length control protein FliK
MQPLPPSPAPAAAPRSLSGAPPAPAAPSAPGEASSPAPLPFNLFIAQVQDTPAADSESADTDKPDAAADGAAPAAADSGQQLPSMADNGMPVLLNFPPPPATASAASEGAAGAARLAPLGTLPRNAGVPLASTAITPTAVPTGAPAAAPAMPAATSDDSAGALPLAATAAKGLAPADSAAETTIRSAPQPGAPLFAGLVPATTESPAAAAAAVKLPGNPDQWQQPLRDALGDRLQVQLQRNSEQATIRLDPPNLGRIDISIRHSAGVLQVNLSASNNEVLRQLNAIGDNVRQDLSQRQYTDVAVTVSATPRGQQQGYADGGQGGRQPGREQQQRAPGRALSDDEPSSAAFAMSTDRE